MKPGLPETLILSGGRVGIIPPALVRKFMQRMKTHGNKSSFVEYPEAGHGFFNYGKNESNKYFRQTMSETEKFLQLRGYLRSESDMRTGKNTQNTLTAS